MTSFICLFQIKRLEGLLNKCKDTIRNSKERNQQLTVEKDALQKTLEEKNAEVENMKVWY